MKYNSQIIKLLNKRITHTHIIFTSEYAQYSNQMLQLDQPIGWVLRELKTICQAIRRYIRHCFKCKKKNAYLKFYPFHLFIYVSDKYAILLQTSIRINEKNWMLKNKLNKTKIIWRNTWHFTPVITTDLIHVSHYIWLNWQLRYQNKCNDQ